MYSEIVKYCNKKCSGLVDTTPRSETIEPHDVIIEHRLTKLCIYRYNCHSSANILDSMKDFHTDEVLLPSHCLHYLRHIEVDIASRFTLCLITMIRSFAYRWRINHIRTIFSVRWAVVGRLL